MSTVRDAHRRLDRLVAELRKRAADSPRLGVYPLSYATAPGERRPEFVSVTLESSRDASVRIEFEIDLAEDRSDVDAFSGVGGAETRAFGPDPVPFSLESGYRLGIDDTPAIRDPESDGLEDLGSAGAMAGRVVEYLTHCLERLERDGA